MTMADLLMAALVRAQIAGSLAIVLVLMLRAPAREVFGAELAYALWAVVPASATISLFPTLPEFCQNPRGCYVPGLLPALPQLSPLAPVWFAGAAVMALLIAASEIRFRMLAERGEAGPAVMGLSWPRLIIPADFAERFTHDERQLILRHERTHIARRDPNANVFIAAMQLIGWFNPLVHLAAACARLDQELACDAAVVQGRPELRRDYGATLLKAHAARPSSPFACGWSMPGRHPLEIRLSMLKRPPLSLSRYLRGAAAIALTAVVVSLAVWSTAPGGPSAPSFDWPPVALRPSG